MLCHTLKNVKGKTVSDASARNKVKSSKYGEDSILQKSDLLFFFSIFPAVFIGVSCLFECSPRKCFIIIIAKKIVWKWTLRKEYSLISFKRLKWMRNMKATMQNTLWSKIKRRVNPNHAKKSLRIILLWDFRNCILWYYTFEMCPKKVDWNVKPFFRYRSCRNASGSCNCQHRFFVWWVAFTSSWKKKQGQGTRKVRLWWCCGRWQHYLFNCKLPSLLFSVFVACS